MPDTPLPLGMLSLDADGEMPLYRQLYRSLKDDFRRIA